MERIAHVSSRYLPPAVVFMDGKLRHPFRIYSDKEGKLCAIICEIPLPSDSSYPIAYKLLDWAEEKGVKELVVLEGIPVKGIPKERKPFCAAEPEKVKECQEKGVKMIKTGIISGIAGSILNECLTRKIIGLVFLTPAITYIPDPEGAAILIKALNNIYDLKIDIENLLKRGKEIKQKLKEVAKRHQRIRRAEERTGRPNLYI
jgi:uncharacterized protein